MALSVVRLRRWFAAVGILACLAVAGVYFHAKHKVQNALRQVPGKLNIEIQQSANSFTISKSEQGRTLFKLQANRAVQFKQGGRADLQDVMITIYGKDSSRFDQVYGKTFEYDQQSGDVTSTGEVSIDLQSNPQGTSGPDQATPKELKNPIHLKTTNLVFNQRTGDAWTSSAVEFHVPQMNGSAVGAKYDAKQNLLTLQSQVRMTTSGATPLTVLAEHAVLGKDPREILLQHPRAESLRETGRADEARLYLREDNSLDHAVANGNVAIRTSGAESGSSEVTAQKLEVAMGQQNRIDNAVFSGDVHMKTEGAQSSEGTAGRAVLSFVKRNTLTKIHSEQQVKLLQHQGPAANRSQDVEVSAPMMDILLASGNRLTHAETFGPPLIRLLPAEGKVGDRTVVTADKFTAKFDSAGQISQVHGESNARVVSTAPQSNLPQTQRVSTSDRIDAHFRPGSGIESVLQEGHFAYQAGTQQAFGKTARYTPADQILTLNGSPRFVDSGTETTATSMRLNRSTGEAFALGDVKTTYNDLKQQPTGGLLASSDPIHVAAESMTAQNNPGSATYKGNARLWQDANLVEASTIQFQKSQRLVIADSNSQQTVSTALNLSDKNGKTTSVHITSDHLTYSDSERKAHYEGSVIAQSSDMTVRCNQMDVFFATAQSLKRETPVARQTTNASLDKIVALGSVSVTQPKRRVTGEKLIYTSADDKFVMTGGPPSIFDAEHGKITGVSLTLYRTDDRVVVVGSSSSPAVTETRVVR